METLKKLIHVGLLLLLIHNTVCASVVSGTLKSHAGQQLKIKGFNGIAPVLLAETLLDASGNFVLNYPSEYKGMGYLEFSEKEQFMLVLNEETISINGNHLTDLASITISNSSENKWLEEYSAEHQTREKTLAGWNYLLPQYQQKKAVQTANLIAQEINRLEMEDRTYLNNLPPSSYMYWYLPKRNYLQRIANIAQYYPEQIPNCINKFREINFSDKRFNNSGLLGQLIEKHYWLLENSGQPLDSAYIQMNRSTDYIISKLEGHEELLNKVTDFLFDYLEKHSLFKASEYLAIEMLTQNSCTLDQKLADQLETYRAMKVGNTAPDLLLEGQQLKLNQPVSELSKLSEINNAYTLVVFGASWCPKCVKEIPEIMQYYQKWKNNQLEVVFISLDTDQSKYVEFVKDFPWLSVCDFKGWDSQMAKNYYIFSTPTLFLVDNNLKIVARPTSLQQVDSWVKYKL